MQSSQKRILAVDDERRYLRLMRVNLEAAGYAFTGADSGPEAIDLLVQDAFDLAIFDVRMPGMDGYALIETVREFSDVPIIFVTAMGEEADKVRGLTLGADDYLVKPYGAPELLARVEAVLRRYRRSDSQDAQVTLGDLRIDFAQHRVFRDSTEVRLSRMEYRLLADLVRHHGKVVPQDQLVREVWGPAYDENFEGLRVYIYRLRHKLEVDPDDPRYLVTFPGVGYMVKAPEPPVGSAA
jgi:two-component system, OmpR family, KDP operon response regulator KdpE